MEAKLANLTTTQILSALFLLTKRLRFSDQILLAFLASQDLRRFNVVRCDGQWQSSGVEHILSFATMGRAICRDSAPPHNIVINIDQRASLERVLRKDPDVGLSWRALQQFAAAFDVFEPASLEVENKQGV